MERRSNKETIQYLFEQCDKGNLKVIDEVYWEDYTDHTPTAARSMRSGLEGVKYGAKIFYDALPDTKHKMKRLIAEGDFVTAHIWAEGTHTGELLGLAPTGKVLEMDGIVIYKFKEDKIIERWGHHSPGIFEQLGIDVSAQKKS